MSAMDITHLDAPDLHDLGPDSELHDSVLPQPEPFQRSMPSAEAVATSREPQHWGRAMAVAIGKLADQLASEEGHEALLGRGLRLRITEDPDGVRIAVWCLPAG